MTLEMKLVSGPLELPQNYLPTAFGLIGGAMAGVLFPLIPVPLLDEQRRHRRALAVPVAVLQDPAALSALIGAEGDGGAYAIGPAQAPGLDPTQRSTIPDAFPGVTDKTVIGVIDFGIAFWSDRFCSLDPGGARHSRFVDIGFLDFDPAIPGVPVVDFLTRAGVADILALSQTPGGRRRVIAELGQRHANSVYGADPERGRPFRPDGMNHGTAMADLAGGAVPRVTSDPTPAPVMFGIELPVDAVLDSSGETLQAVLNVALLQLLDRVAIWAAGPGGERPDLRIVLSFAFPGGPDDGSHPAVQTLAAILDRHPLAQARVQLFVATGNHLQDQIHASVPAGGTGVEMLTWLLHPDDHAPNTLEALAPCAKALRLHLGHPDGRALAVMLGVGDYARLYDRGRLIGAVWCAAHDDGVARLRVSLGATSAPAPAPRAMPGEWRIGVQSDVTTPERAIDYWILRKDRSGLSRSMAPARQSRFRDPGYVRRRKDGTFHTDDSASEAATRLRRAGTASLLATGSFERITPVGALEQIGTDPATRRPAWYSGLLRMPSGRLQMVLVDRGRPGRGMLVHGNDGPRRFRVSGTSAAAASGAR